MSASSFLPSVSNNNGTIPDPIIIAKLLEINYMVTPTQIIANPTLHSQSLAVPISPYSTGGDPYASLYSDSFCVQNPTPLDTLNAVVIIVPSTLIIKETDIPKANENQNIDIQRLARLKLPSLNIRYRGVMPVALQSLGNPAASIACGTPYYPQYMSAGISAGYNPFDNPAPTLSSMALSAPLYSQRANQLSAQISANNYVKLAGGVPQTAVCNTTPCGPNTTAANTTAANTTANYAINGYNSVPNQIPVQTQPVQTQQVQTQPVQTQPQNLGQLSAVARRKMAQQGQQQQMQQQMQQQAQQQMQQQQQQMQQQQMQQQMQQAQQLNQSIASQQQQAVNLTNQVNNDITNLNGATGGNLSYYPYSEQTKAAFSEFQNSFGAAPRSSTIVYNSSAGGYCQSCNPKCNPVKCTLEYPSYKVQTVVDEANFRMVIKCTLYLDPTVGYTNEVYINLAVLVPLVMNVQQYIPGLDAQTRINLLACSGLMSILPVPSDEEVFGAFVIWIFNYVTFFGATKWKVDNIPWIPFVDFDWTSYEYNVVPNGSAQFDVTYFIYNRLLMYVDVAFESVYALTPIQYQRWCSLAEGGGWYVLMYPGGFNDLPQNLVGPKSKSENDCSCDCDCEGKCGSSSKCTGLGPGNGSSDDEIQEENVYRHIHILTALQNQNTWRIRRIVLNQAVQIAVINQRLSYYDQILAQMLAQMNQLLQTNQQITQYQPFPSFMSNVRQTTIVGTPQSVVTQPNQPNQ